MGDLAAQALDLIQGEDKSLFLKDIVPLDCVVIVSYATPDGHNDIAFITTDSIKSNLVGLLAMTPHHIIGCIEEDSHGHS